MQASEGFPPIARADARILILGSLPGQKSLAAAQYYAHPQNAFWRIMRDLLAIDGGYEQRCLGLQAAEIAVWDVLKASVRPGSLDADIKRDTALANDFASFFAMHGDIESIAFNGKKAEALFRTMVPGEHWRNKRLLGLPSTSPAYAAMPYADKLKLWSAGLLQS